MENAYIKHISRAITWVEIAEADLKTSISLYNAGDYCNSIYHLQQAIEKAVKSLIIYLDTEDKITDDYLKSEYGHFKTYNFFYDFLTIDENGKREDIPQDVDKLLTKFKTISKGREHPKDIPIDDYEFIIDMITLFSRPAALHNVYKITRSVYGGKATATRLLRNWQVYAKKNNRNKAAYFKKN